MIVDPDLPYTLSEPDEVKRRLAMLTQPHIAPLIAHAQQITARLGSSYQIPYFDPCDGGIHSEVLFLLEAPGRKAMVVVLYREITLTLQLEICVLCSTL